MMNRIVDLLSERFRETIRPYVFVGPALVILAVFLVYPVFNTIFISFENSTSTEFVGLDNYKFVFTDVSMLRSIRNTVGWLAPRVMAVTSSDSMPHPRAWRAAARVDFPHPDLPANTTAPPALSTSLACKTKCPR